MDQLAYDLPKLSADFASHLNGQVPWYLRNKGGKSKVKPRSQSQPNQKGHSSRGAKLLREPSFYFKSNGRKSTSGDRRSTRSMSEKYLQIGVPMTHLKRPATTSHYSRIESSLSNPVNAIKFHDCQNNHSMTNLRDVRDSVSQTYIRPRSASFFQTFPRKTWPLSNTFFSEETQLQKTFLSRDLMDLAPGYYLNQAWKVNVCRLYQSKSNKNFKELTRQTRNSSIDNHENTIDNAKITLLPYQITFLHGRCLFLWRKPMEAWN